MLLRNKVNMIYLLCILLGINYLVIGNIVTIWTATWSYESDSFLRVTVWPFILIKRFCN
jgi:hypothetical protein